MDRKLHQTDIFARMAHGRRAKARLNFDEKLAALDALRDRVRPLVVAKRLKQATRADTTSTMGGCGQPETGACVVRASIKCSSPNT